jgi:hypothetical protein
VTVNYADIRSIAWQFIVAGEDAGSQLAPLAHRGNITGRRHFRKRAMAIYLATPCRRKLR